MTVREQIERLTSKQREVLGLICMGQTGGHHPSSLQALERRGLIAFRERGEQVLYGGAIFRYKDPEVPRAVHIAYCEWAADQPDTVSL